jgi:hypothetical protein
MAKKSKLKTPDWILKGEKAPKPKPSGKTFKIRTCPKCGSDDVGVEITGEDCKRGKCNWECHKCKWKGQNIKEEVLGEEEFLKRMEK